jgi:two-component system, NarL family, response regulator DesR
MQDATIQFGAGGAPLKVLCVDDNPLVVEALALKLGLLGGFEWLAPVDDADRLVEVVGALQPDIILLDLDMPGRDPLDALAELARLGSASRVLIFSGHSRADLVERAIDAGAWGFVSKHSDVETIVAAILRVARGEFLLASEAGDEESSVQS